MGVAIKHGKANGGAGRKALERVVALPYTHAQAEAFHTAFLLLADEYIAGGKYDHASTILKRALSHNASLVQAWDLLGHVHEHLNEYAEATEAYASAWALTDRMSPDIGYKLALNYLKIESWIPAIETSHAVLRINPAYPEIRTVLTTAR